MHKDIWYVIPVTMLAAISWYGWAVDPAYREALTSLIHLTLIIVVGLILPAALLAWLIEKIGGDRHE